MQADSISNGTISRELNHHYRIKCLICDNHITCRICSCFYSWVLGVVNFFLPLLFCPIRTRIESRAPPFRRLPVERSFSQQRMCLLLPHHPPCVHKNLRNSSGKCQYTGSMMIRHFRHYFCLSSQNWAQGVVNHVFSCGMIAQWAQKQGDNVTLMPCFFVLAVMWKGKTDKLWRIWARRSRPLLFLTGFWLLPMSQQEVQEVRLLSLSSPHPQDWSLCLPICLVGSLIHCSNILPPRLSLCLRPNARFTLPTHIHINSQVDTQ